MPAIIDQIFAQSQAGNANGAIMPGFAEGARLSMERRRLDSELATEDLQRQTMRDMATFNSQMQRLKLEEARLNMQKMVGLQSAATEASRLVAWAIQEPSVLDTPEFRSHTATALNNPLVMATDSGKTLFGMVNGRNAHNQALKAGLRPTSQSVRTDTGVETFAAPFDPEAAGLEVSGYNAKTGAPTYARPRAGDGETEKEAPVLETLTGKDGKTYTVLFNKNTGKSEIVDAAAGTRYGPKSGITGATQTKAEATMNTGENLVSRARTLSKLLRPENVGPRGFFNRAADQFLPNVIPGWKVGDAVEAQTVAGEFQAGVIRLFMSDSNIAKDERNNLVKLVPNPTSFFGSSAPTEKLKLAQVLLDAGQMSRRAAALKKAPITESWLKQNEIQAMWERGEIDDEKATQLLQNSGWALIAELRAQVANGQ